MAGIQLQAGQTTHNTFQVGITCSLSFPPFFFLFFFINFQVILEEYILIIALRDLFADMTMVQLRKATLGK